MLLWSSIAAVRRTLWSLFSVLSSLALVTSCLNAQPRPRHYLVEFCTSQTCVPCLTVERKIDSSRETFGADNLVVLSYYGWLARGNGDDNQLFVRQNDSIQNYLLIGENPTLWFNHQQPLLMGGSAYYMYHPTNTLMALSQVPLLLSTRIVNAAYDADKQKFSADIDIAPTGLPGLPAEDTNRYYVVGVLTEDSTNVWNVDDSYHIDSNARQYDVVRTATGSIMGDPITFGSALMKYPSLTRRHVEFDLSDTHWNPDHLRFKAYVYYRGPSRWTEHALDADQTPFLTRLPQQTPQAMWTTYPEVPQFVSAGKHMWLTWSANDLSLPVRLEYSYDGVNWGTIDTLTGTRYDWVAPTESDDHAVHVRVVRIADTTIHAVFPPFTVFGIGNRPTLLIESPAETKTLICGQFTTIQFLVSGAVGEQRTAQVSMDSGQHWTSIGTTTGSEILWKIPATRTTQAFLRVTANNAGDTIGPLVIQMPLGTVSKNSISSAPRLTRKESASVLWSCTGYVGDSCTLEYTLGETDTWHLIRTLATQSGTNSISWRVPDATSDTALVRIRTSEHLVALSDTFSIQDPVAVEDSPTPQCLIAVDPASREVTVSYDDARSIVVEVYDLLGVRRSTVKGVSRIEWSRLGQPNAGQAVGSYLLRIRVIDSNGAAHTLIRRIQL